MSNFRKGSGTSWVVVISANEQGFMQGWNFITSSPEPQPNKINKDEVNNKKYSNERPAETKAQQR